MKVVVAVRNPILLFGKWLHYVLFEERDDPYVPNPKRKKIIHNAHLIQAWAALTGLVSFGLIPPLFAWLIAVPGFVMVYLAWCVIMGAANLALKVYVHKLNEEEYLKEPKQAGHTFHEYGF